MSTPLILASGYSRQFSVAGVTSLSFVNSAEAGGAITIPADAAVGDLAVLLEGASSSNGIVTGWTPMLSNGIANANYKVLVSGDPGDTINGSSGSGQDKIMLVFRPNGVISSVAFSTWLFEATSGNPTPQAVSASGQPAPLVVIGAVYKANSTVSFNAGTTPAFDAQIARSDNDLVVGYKIYNSAPANHTVDCDDFGSFTHALFSGYIRVS